MGGAVPTASSPCHGPLAAEVGGLEQTGPRPGLTLELSSEPRPRGRRGWKESEPEAAPSKHPPGAIREAAGWVEGSPFLLLHPRAPSACEGGSWQALRGPSLIGVRAPLSPHSCTVLLRAALSSGITIRMVHRGLRGSEAKPHDGGHTASHATRLLAAHSSMPARPAGPCITLGVLPQDQELESLSAIEAELEKVAQQLQALRRG